MTSVERDSTSGSFAYNSAVKEDKKRKFTEFLGTLPATCRNYLRYQGVARPRCNGGSGCKICWQVYLIKHPGADFPYEEKQF